MSYKVNRSLGYQPWGVTNPWVFADLSQPQRQRGNVSPMVFQTAPPALRSAHLGATEDQDEAAVVRMKQAIDAEKRAERMEKYALVTVALSTASLAMYWMRYSELKRVKPNRKRRRRRRRSR